MRLDNYVNEKVNKKEIEDALRSTDVLVGAEFEFKIDDASIDDFQSDYKDQVEKSIEYDNALSVWEEEYDQWVREHDNYIDELDSKYDESDLSDNEIRRLKYEEFEKWEDNNPRPEEPEMPDDYLREYERSDQIAYPQLEEYLQNLLPDVVRDAMDWEIHEDSSLSDNGIELVSPPLPIDDFFDECEKVFKMIYNIGNTDDECGLHIGVSLKSGMDKVDAIKLLLFTDEGYIWKMFDSRKCNDYVEHVRGIIQKSLLKSVRGPMPNIFDDTDNVSENEKIDKLRSMVRKDELKKINYETDHYHGVNIQHLHSSNPYIEFRYMGGEGYHTKFEKVKLIVAQYIYNLKLSRDPNFKKKEYVSKINRILRKFEAYAVDNEILEIEEKIRHIDPIRYSMFMDLTPKEAAEKDRKELQIQLKNLKRKSQFLPKLNNSEKMELNRMGL